MQKSKKIGLSILIVLLSTICLGIFTISDFLLPSKSIESAPIPKNYDWAVRIDASTFVKEELYSIVFQSKDEQLLNQLRNLIDRKWKSKGKNGGLYIDYQSDIIFYQKTENGNAFNGIILKTKRPNKCEQNIPAYLKSNQISKVKDNSLIIVTQKSGKSLTKTQLTALIEKYSAIDGSVEFIETKQQRDLLQMNMRSSSNIESMSNLKLGIRNSKNSISMYGNFTSNTSNKNYEALYSISGKGVKIYSYALPNQFNDSIIQFFNLRNTFKLTGISMDYHGLIMEEAVEDMYNKAGFTPIPMINAVFQFNSSITVEQLLQNLPEHFKVNSGKITFNNVKYSIKQIDERSIFIGLDPSTVEQQNQSNYIYLGGNFSKLFNLKASYFITTFFEAMPAVKATKSFLSKTEKVEFKANLNGTKGTINGQFLFNDKSHALNEVTKLFIGLGIFK